MSASLVGSEMCIRDRPISIALVASELHRPIGSRAPRSGQQGTAVCVAVSYTHLTLPTICSV
eukprot:1894456-Alexandrium_andersonii.AAC.1